MIDDVRWSSCCAWACRPAANAQEATQLAQGPGHITPPASKPRACPHSAGFGGCAAGAAVRPAWSAGGGCDVVGTLVAARVACGVAVAGPRGGGAAASVGLGGLQVQVEVRMRGGY